MTPVEIQRAFDIFLSDWTTTSIRWMSEPAPSLPYIEPHILFGDMIGLEIGGVAERVGVIHINIFTVMTTGDLPGLTYGGDLEKMFWHKSTGALYFENGDQMPSTYKSGIDEARQAYHFITKVPFNIITEY